MLCNQRMSDDSAQAVVPWGYEGEIEEFCLIDQKENPTVSVWL
jgi:hypothetical protein